MTDTASADQESANIVHLLKGAIEIFTADVPDWHMLPPSAFLIYLEDVIYDAREWAFKAHSPSKAEAWKARIKQYAEALPKLKEQSELEELPEVTDELGMCICRATGAAFILTAAITGMIEVDGDGASTVLTEKMEEFWTNTLLERPDRLQMMEGWGDQAYTWITLKLESQLQELRPLLLEYEAADDDEFEEISTQLAYFIILCASLLMVLSLNHERHNHQESATENN